MATQSIETIRSEAKRLVIAWARVEAACREIRDEERLAREHLNLVRRTAWTCYTANTPWAWPFWRIGFASRLGKRVDAADYTAVPGYDVLHQQIATEFPEWADDDGCERLWAFLLAPYNPVPRRAELYERALARTAAVAACGSADFQFGANLAIL